MTALCTALYQNFYHEGWNEWDLAKLPQRDLQFLCALFSVARYGSKEAIVVRLLSIRIVRQELSKFQNDPTEVVASFKHSRLRWMCEQANLWKSGNKTALAIVLLNWRNRCRHEGKKFLEECRAYTKRHGVQQLLPL